MRIPLGRGDDPFLTYCMNVHPIADEADVLAMLRGPAAAIRKSLATSADFGLGLFLPSDAAAAFAVDGFLAEELADAILEIDGHALTTNAFPFRAFHEQVVKRGVYRPDWTSEERVEYTRNIAEILVSLPAASDRQSISTLPGTFRGFGPVDDQRIAANLARVAVELFLLSMQYDRHLVLAVEPEPGCAFETTSEWIRFYEEVLLRGSWPELERLKPGRRDLQESILRRHVGICFDACHAAVMGEDAVASLEALAAAGIEVMKFQISSAVRASEPSRRPEVRAALDRLAEPRWLHQVVAEDASGRRSTFEDLPDYLAAAPSRDDREVRVHFHVPVFADNLGALGTTRTDMERALRHSVSRGLCRHYEIETYSWSALPDRDATSADQLVADVVAEYRHILGVIAE